MKERRIAERKKSKKEERCLMLEVGKPGPLLRIRYGMFDVDTETASVYREFTSWWRIVMMKEMNPRHEQAAMISKNFGVNAAMGSQCVNVCQDGFAKIASEAGRLALIESKPGD